MLLLIHQESTGFESSEECPKLRVRSEKCPCASYQHCTFGPWCGSSHHKPAFMVREPKKRKINRCMFDSVFSKKKKKKTSLYFFNQILVSPKITLRFRIKGEK